MSYAARLHGATLLGYRCARPLRSREWDIKPHSNQLGTCLNSHDDQNQTVRFRTKPFVLGFTSTRAFRHRRWSPMSSTR